METEIDLFEVPETSHSPPLKLTFLVVYVKEGRSFVRIGYKEVGVSYFKLDSLSTPSWSRLVKHVGGGGDCQDVW